jgi:adenine deaminase
MLKPVEFAKAVLPHGTTAVVTDPHEIANVSGMDGIEYMMEASEGLPLDVYFVLPSCVPATAYDESGCILKAQDLEPYFHNKKVLGLAEVMDYYETIHGDYDILQKIADAKSHHKIVDGHAPGLQGKEVNAYIAAGVQSDHECINMKEALEKLSLGQWIMIREGTAAKNLDALMGLFTPPYHQRAMLVSDDKHPYDILTYGHIDDMLRQAIQKGANPCIAIKMATFNTANYFGIKDTGAIAPGYKADIVILSNLEKVKVEKVIKNGKLIIKDQNQIELMEPIVRKEILDKVYHSFHCDEIVAEDFKITPEEDVAGVNYYRAINFVKGEITTRSIKVPLINGKPEIVVADDILKIAVIERHHNTNHIGIGFVHGYGLKMGAIASSVSHDSHNIIVIGTNDTDIAIAANCIRDMQGGWAIALEGKIIANLPLSIGGLISNLDAVTLSENISEMKGIATSLGVEEGIDPFMNLAFISLTVIPELRLTTFGLFDVSQQQLVPILI